MHNPKLIEFIVPHARNHLQNLLWIAINSLHHNKHQAISLQVPQHNNKTIDEEIIEAKIFQKYREAILDIEFFFNLESKKFIDELEQSMDDVNRRMKNKSDKVKKEFLSKQIQQFSSEIKVFEQNLHSEYRRIIPIQFPILITSFTNEF